MKQSFEKFMSSLRTTNRTLDFFCDFDKASDNVEDIRLELCMLNSLIGCENFFRGVETIWRRDPSVFRVLPILLAVRDGSVLVSDAYGQCVEMDSMFDSVESVVNFLEDSGLAKVLRERQVKDLLDYAFGIEVGLDTNARKNRGGQAMERHVASELSDARLPFRSEVYSTEWPELQRALGADKKRFDFAIEFRSVTYLLEVNFYHSGGSKLNEVARAYSELAPIVNGVRGFQFVWVTDGVGWHSAANKIEQAYRIIPRVYNLTSLSSFILELKMGL